MTSSTAPLTGRLAAAPNRLLHEEVLAPRVRFEAEHLLPHYLAGERFDEPRMRSAGVRPPRPGRRAAGRPAGRARVDPRRPDRPHRSGGLDSGARWAGVMTDASLLGTRLPAAGCTGSAHGTFRDSISGPGVPATAAAGQPVGPPRNAYDRLGHVIAEADTADGVVAALDAALAQVEVRIT